MYNNALEDLPGQPQIRDVEGCIADLLIHEERAQADLKQIQEDWQQVLTWKVEDTRAEPLLQQQLQVDSLADFWQEADRQIKELAQSLNDFVDETWPGARKDLPVVGLTAATCGAVAGAAIGGVVPLIVAPFAGIQVPLWCWAGSLEFSALRAEVQKINQRVEDLSALRSRLEHACSVVAGQLEEQ